jgi:hypothetical protein
MRLYRSYFLYQYLAAGHGRHSLLSNSEQERQQFPASLILKKKSTFNYYDGYGGNSFPLDIFNLA